MANQRQPVITEQYNYVLEANQAVLYNYNLTVLDHLVQGLNSINELYLKISRSIFSQDVLSCFNSHKSCLRNHMHISSRFLLVYIPTDLHPHVCFF